MGNTTTTPNMGLSLPIPTVEVGPAWATELNAAMTLVDAHDHSTGKGVQITPAGININSALSLNINNLISARSLRLYPFPSTGAFNAVGTDLGCLYEIAPELYFLDGAGNSVQITKNGFVNSGSGSISGLGSYPNASASYLGSQGSFVFQQGVSTAGNIDAATLIIRYPGSYPTPSGNYIMLQAPSSLASGYSLTLPGVPAQTNLMTLSASGVIGSATYQTTGDLLGPAMTSVGANAIAATRTRGVGVNEGIGGVAISNSCGLFSTTSSSPVGVTNLSCTLSTSGRPVVIQLISDGSSNADLQQVEATSNSSGSAGLVFSIYRGATILTYSTLEGVNSGTASAITAPPGIISYVDPVAAGTYTYSLAVAAATTSTTVYVQYCKLVAYEL